MTKNRTRTPVYLDPGMHPGLEVKGLKTLILSWSTISLFNVAFERGYILKNLFDQFDVLRL